jgi:hypothetical protein
LLGKCDNGKLFCKVHGIRPFCLGISLFTQYFDVKAEWQQIAQIVDRVLLSIFVIVTLTVTVVVMVQGPAMYGTPINIDIHD